MVDAMSKSMSNNKVIYCRFHDQEHYQLYCKDCRELVCFECLQDKHDKHSVRRIKDSENDIRMCLQSTFFEKEEIALMNGQIDEALDELYAKRTDIIAKIEQEADLRKKQIDISKDNLVLNISSTVDGYVSDVNVKERLQGLKEKVTWENVLQYDVWQLVETMVEWRNILEKTSLISQFPNSIKFEKSSCDFFLGNIVSVAEPAENSVNSTQAKHFNTTFTQTETVEERDEEAEWFDADDKLDLVEYSSDIETQVKYPIAIKINEDIKRIDKIIPISETDAWILIDRKLRFLKEHNLEGKIYATNIDDIGVLGNGNVLLLCHTQPYIMQLLPNKIIVRFANAECYTAMPRCLFVNMNDKSVVVCSSKQSSGKDYFHIIKLSVDGVMIDGHRFDRYWNWLPCNVLDLQSRVCIRQGHIQTNLHSLDIINVSTNKLEVTHNGTIGCSPSSHFECYGICSDHSSHLLVSDFRHHCVYALDSEMKYKKTVATSRDGLHDPTAIALLQNALWIADKQQILIFNYDSTECSLIA